MTNAFVDAVNNTPFAQTENGAATFDSSGSALVDLFDKVGSAKSGNDGRTNILDLYQFAAAGDKQRAIRTMLWARDIRGGAGRRQAFRDWLVMLEANDAETLELVLPFVPEFGRWDDLLVFKTVGFQILASRLIGDALRAGNGLCAKWMPRKGEVAARLRTFLEMTPKQYRKTLVRLSNVVETPMCAKNYDAVIYDHVPSVAASRYKKAFMRNDGARYKAYVAELIATPVSERKVNVGALYPFDIVHSLGSSKTEQDMSQAQWDALPNYVGNHAILPLVDVSGSMCSSVQGRVSAMDVSTSIGMYLAEKNTGPFKDMVLNFSDRSEFVKLQGNLAQRYNQILRMPWGGSTNVQAAFDNILNVATAHRVPANEMPKILLIISDMEFNNCSRNTNYQEAQRKFNAAGYECPTIVFWNVNGRAGNSAVRATDPNVALISGFSPSIVESVLKSEKVDPITVVDRAIMKDRYDIWNSVPKAA